MQEKKTLQDLPAPTTQDFWFHHFKSLQIPRAQTDRSEYKENEVLSEILGALTAETPFWIKAPY